MATIVKSASPMSDYKTSGVLYTGTQIQCTRTTEIAVDDYVIVALAGDAATNVGLVRLTDTGTFDYVDYLTVTSAVSGDNSGNCKIQVNYVKITSLPNGSSAINVGINGGSSSEAKAAMAWIVRGIDTTTPTDVSTSSYGSGTAPDSGSTGTSSQADQFVVAAIAREGPSDDTLGSWSAPSSGDDDRNSGTNSNGATANITLDVRVVSVSSTATRRAYKTGATDRDWAAAVVAFNDASGTPVVTGAVPMSGTGGLTAASFLTIPSQSAMSGTGLLTASASLFVLAQSQMEGLGELVAAGDRLAEIVTGAVPMSGAGDMSANSLIYRHGAVEMSMVSTLSANAMLYKMAQAALSGSGALTPDAYLIIPSASAMSGTGGMTIAASVLGGTYRIDGLGTFLWGVHGAVGGLVTGQVAMSGAGALTAAGYQIALGSSAMSGAGALTADAMVYVLSSAALSGQGAMVVAGDVLGLVTGQVAMSGTGALTSGAMVYILGQSAMSGTGTLVAAGDVLMQIVTGQAALSGTGGLTSGAMVYVLGQSAISGLGSMVVAADVLGVVTAQAAFSGTGSLASDAMLFIPAATIMQGQGGTSIIGFAIKSGASAMSALGALEAIGGVYVPSDLPSERVMLVMADLKNMQVQEEGREPLFRDEIRVFFVILEDREKVIKAEDRVFAPKLGQVN